MKISMEQDAEKKMRLELIKEEKLAQLRKGVFNSSSPDEIALIMGA